MSLRASFWAFRSAGSRLRSGGTAFIDRASRRAPRIMPRAVWAPARRHRRRTRPPFWCRANGSQRNASRTAMSAEAATEPVGEFDLNTVRIGQIGGPAAWPVDRRIVEQQSMPHRVDAATRLVDAVDYGAHMTDVEVRTPVGAFGHLEKADVEPIAVAKNAPSVAFLLDLDPQQSGIEVDRPGEIANGQVHMVDAARVDGLGRRLLLARLQCSCHDDLSHLEKSEGLTR